MKNWLIIDLDARTEASQCSEETTMDRESLPEKESRHTEEVYYSRPFNES
jgi:hypothetical protein